MESIYRRIWRGTVGSGTYVILAHTEAIQVALSASTCLRRQKGTWKFLRKVFQNLGPLRDKTWAGTHLPGSEGSSTYGDLLWYLFACANSLNKISYMVFSSTLLSCNLAFIAFCFFFLPHHCRACGILVNPHSPTKDGTSALSSERM